MRLSSSSPPDQRERAKKQHQPPSVHHSTSLVKPISGALSATSLSLSVLTPAGIFVSMTPIRKHMKTSFQHPSLGKNGALERKIIVFHLSYNKTPCHKTVTFATYSSAVHALFDNGNTLCSVPPSELLRKNFNTE
jgi:hypothetical protein